MDSRSLFYCYDLNLVRFLRYERNIPFITKARHLTTDKVFHLFFVDNVFQEALDEYNGKK